jgi:hypothetical protein
MLHTGWGQQKQAVTSTASSFKTDRLQHAVWWWAALWRPRCCCWCVNFKPCQAAASARMLAAIVCWLWVPPVASEERRSACYRAVHATTDNLAHKCYRNSQHGSQPPTLVSFESTNWGEGLGLVRPISTSSWDPPCRDKCIWREIWSRPFRAQTFDPSKLHPGILEKVLVKRTIDEVASPTTQGRSA